MQWSIWWPAATKHYINDFDLCSYAEPLWICISDIWQYNVHVIATLYFDCRIYVFELVFLHFTEILTQWRKTRLIVHICTLCTVKLVARCMYTLSSSVCLFSKDKSMYCIDLQTFSGFCLFWHLWKSWNFFLFFRCPEKLQISWKS